MRRSSVLLPEPLRADDRDHFARLDGEADAAKYIAIAVSLPYVRALQEWCIGLQRLRRRMSSRTASTRDTGRCGTLTAGTLAACAVVIRRTMAGLREAGFVRSEKGQRRRLDHRAGSQDGIAA